MQFMISCFPGFQAACAPTDSGAVCIRRAYFDGVSGAETIQKIPLKAAGLARGGRGRINGNLAAGKSFGNKEPYEI